MGKIVRIIVSKSAGLIGQAAASCRINGLDNTAIFFDTKGSGVSAVRNTAVMNTGLVVDDNDYIQFVDDDDICIPITHEQLIKDAGGYDYDLLIYPFISDGVLIRPRPWPECIVDGMISGNWFIRYKAIIEYMERNTGNFFVGRSKDIAFWTFLEAYLVDKNLTVKVFPDNNPVYFWRRGVGYGDQLSSKKSTELTIHRILGMFPHLIDGRCRVARQLNEYNNHAVRVAYKFRNRIGRYPNYNNAESFLDKMAVRVAFDDNPVLRDMCCKAFSNIFVSKLGVPIPPDTMVLDIESKKVLWCNNNIVSNQFIVVKPSRASQRNKCIVVGKEGVLESIRRIVGEFQNINYARKSLEWGYLGPELIVAQRNMKYTMDVKVYVFDGVIKFWEAYAGTRVGFGNTRISSVYDSSMNHVGFNPVAAPGNIFISHKTTKLITEYVEKMKSLLSGIDMMRVDFMVDNKDDVYFIEFSPYANGIGSRFVDCDMKIGREWNQKVKVNFNVPDIFK